MTPVPQVSRSRRFLSPLTSMCRQIARFGQNSLCRPGFIHSVLFGVASGVVFWGGLCTYRALYLLLLETESVPIASRARYEEKQQLYQQKLSQDTAASILAELVSEYNPVHLRLPFRSFDSVDIGCGLTQESLNNKPLPN